MHQNQYATLFSAVLALLVCSACVHAGVSIGTQSSLLVPVNASSTPPSLRFPYGVHVDTPLPGTRVRRGRLFLRGSVQGFTIGPPGVGDGYICVTLNHVTEWCGFQTGVDGPDQLTRFALELDVRPFLFHWVQPHDDVRVATMAADPIADPAMPRHPFRAYPVVTTVELRSHAEQTVAAAPSSLVWFHPIDSHVDVVHDDDASGGESAESLRRKGNWMPGSLDAQSVNVALHAQSKYSQHGFVAGSEVTTAGIATALRQQAGVGAVQVFAPFAYGDMLMSRWDLVIIEGWYGMVPSFIATMRRRNPKVIILYICLDTYPTPRAFTQLDVDGFLTNGVEMQRVLSRFAPTRRMQLAVDPATFSRRPPHPDYSHPVVYLGHDSCKKDNLHGMLREAIPFGLAIYGGNWNKTNSELSPFYKGILPLDDIAALYSSAKVVIGTTDILQRSLGMVNNRVFEALACGAVLINDQFPALENLMGDNVLYAQSPADVRTHLTRLLGPGSDGAELRARSDAGQAAIRERHTWAHRVQKLLGFYDEISSSRRATNTLRKHEAPYVHATVDPGLGMQPPPTHMSSFQRRRLDPAAPLLPPPTQPYTRPNRPLVAVLVSVADLAAAAAAAPGGLASSPKSPIRSVATLLTHLNLVLGDPELQYHYRTQIIPLAPVAASADSTPRHRQVPAGFPVPVPAVAMSLVHPDHPLHSLWSRVVAVVAIGDASGLAATTAAVWTQHHRSDDGAGHHQGSSVRQSALYSRLHKTVFTGQRFKESVVDLSPRTVLIPSSCADPVLATADEFDAVVCFGTGPGMAARRSQCGGYNRVVQLGAGTSTGLLPFRLRAQELCAVLSNALLWRRAQSWADLLEPLDGSWVAIEDGSIPIRVSVQNFDIPGQGSWAFLVNGTEVMRVGDAIFSLDYGLPPTLEELRAQLTPADGSRVLPSPADAGYKYVLRLQLRLRDGLVREDEVWRGPPVHVTVYSRRETPSWRVAVPVGTVATATKPKTGDGASSTDPVRADLKLLSMLPAGYVAAEFAVPRVSRTTQGVVPHVFLAVGCFQGQLPPASPDDSTRHAAWVRMFDPRCEALTHPDPTTELKAEWLDSVLPRHGTLYEQQSVLRPDTVSSAAPLTDVGLALGDNFLGVQLPPPKGSGSSSPASSPRDLGAPPNANATSLTAAAPPRQLLQTGLEARTERAIAATAAGVPKGILPFPLISRPNTAVVPWDTQSHDALDGFTEGSFDGMTVHWGVLLLPRGGTAEAAQQWFRVLKPGAVIRVVEPDYRYHQAPNRRATRVMAADPEVPTPYAVTNALVAAGFADVTHVQLDETTLTDQWLAFQLAADARDGVDDALAATSPPRVFVVEAKKP